MGDRSAADVHWLGSSARSKSHQSLPVYRPLVCCSIRCQQAIPAAPSRLAPGCPTQPMGPSSLERGPPHFLCPTRARMPQHMHNPDRRDSCQAAYSQCQLHLDLACPLMRSGGRCIAQWSEGMSAKHQLHSDGDATTACDHQMGHPLRLPKGINHKAARAQSKTVALEEQQARKRRVAAAVSCTLLV